MPTTRSPLHLHPGSRALESHPSDDQSYANGESTGPTRSGATPDVEPATRRWDAQREAEYLEIRRLHETVTGLRGAWPLLPQEAAKHIAGRIAALSLRELTRPDFLDGLLPLLTDDVVPPAVVRMAIIDLTLRSGLLSREELFAQPDRELRLAALCEVGEDG